MAGAGFMLGGGGGCSLVADPDLVLHDGSGSLTGSDFSVGLQNEKEIPVTSQLSTVW